MSATDRFWTKVDKTDDCWLWTDYTARDGYGRFRLAGTMVLAHRYSLMLTGVDLDGLRVDHTCHVHACVNPAHLRPATSKQNGENRAGAQANSKTGVRGVYWEKSCNRWRAQVKHNGRQHSKCFTDIAGAEAWAVATRLELYTHNDADRAVA